MSDEQKAAKLEQIADWYVGSPNAALLRECAGMMRERGGVQWEACGAGGARQTTALGERPAARRRGAVAAAG